MKEDILKYGLPTLTRKMLLDLYAVMLRIRMFEERIVDLYPEQEMKCPVHLCIGQEAIAAGVCLNLRKDDYVFSNHRGHGHALAKGSEMRPLMAEFYGKVTGCSRGKGGSMHIIDVENGILGTSAIVAGGIPMGVGSALASTIRKEDRVTVIFFGDGAYDEGALYESFNFASLKKLPVVFFCENNFYATNSHQSARQSACRISEAASAFDAMTGSTLQEEAPEWTSRTRSSSSPALRAASAVRCASASRRKGRRRSSALTATKPASGLQPA